MRSARNRRRRMTTAAAATMPATVKGWFVVHATTACMAVASLPKSVGGGLSSE